MSPVDRLVDSSIDASLPSLTPFLAFFLFRLQNCLLAGCSLVQEGPEALANVESSLEACLVCLMIVTCPGLDRRLCSDELIDQCLGLFRYCRLYLYVEPSIRGWACICFCNLEQYFRFSTCLMERHSTGRTTGKRLPPCLSAPG